MTKEYIDCSFAILNGVSYNKIFDTVEYYFDSVYWRDRSKWEPVYTLLHLNVDGLVVGNVGPSVVHPNEQDFEIIDWYRISDMSDNTLGMLTTCKKFNEELL